MSMFGGDNELGNILQEAVKLKSAQMGQKRQTYEKWPYFVQHTLFHGEKDDFKAWRQLPFDEKIKISEKIKLEGNDLYTKGSWSDAVDKYEEAGTLVHYCYSSDPGWRKNNRGIDDDVLVLVVDEGTNEDEKKQYEKLRLSCCLNLAACKQKLEKYDEAIVACDVALELDKDSVKALYRRAEARIRPGSSTAYDLDLAIKDLAKANAVDPKNTMVEKLLTRLRGERKVQREKDSQTFTGMFDRGELYDGDMEDAKAPCKSELEMRDIQKRIDGISDEDSLDKRVEDAELLRDLYVRNGKEEEAKELHEKIKTAKQAVKAQVEAPPPKVDWANPTPEMIADAQKHGLDLTDPLVIQEMQRLESEGLLENPDGGAAAPEESSSSSFTTTPLGLPLPEVDWSETVPWMRYVVLILCIGAVWLVIRAGLIKTLFHVVVWRRLRRAPQMLGLSVSDDIDEERSSMFATAYRMIVSTFSGDDEDGEL